MWKMATRNEWDELQYHNKENQDDNVENWDRKLNDTDANDDGEDNATAHFTACVALHNWACARCPVPCTLTWLKFESCPHFRSISTPYMVVSLWLDLLHSLLLSLPPVCLPFPVLPPQRRAAAGAQQEDHWKTCATPPKTGVRAPTTSFTSPHNTSRNPNSPRY